MNAIRVAPLVMWNTDEYIRGCGVTVTVDHTDRNCIFATIPGAVSFSANTDAFPGDDEVRIHRIGADAITCHRHDFHRS